MLSMDSGETMFLSDRTDMKIKEPKLGNDMIVDVFYGFLKFIIRHINTKIVVNLWQ